MAISRFKFEGTKSGNPSVYNYFVFVQEIDWKTLQEKYVPYFISMTTNFGQTTK